MNLKSLDYVFRRLALEFLSDEERAELGIETPVRLTSPLHRPDLRELKEAPYCMQCGVQMVQAAHCFACPSCGTTSGCD
ncbi:hypothetical protein KY386_01095 [Candidatus Parcubacteria bacterium]|nr:hypothetical protein [Candidatus Parcubacteria bacterium]